MLFRARGKEEERSILGFAKFFYYFKSLFHNRNVRRLIKSVFYWQYFITYIFSVSLKFRACLQHWAVEQVKKNNYLLESSKFHHSVLVLECLSAQVLLECPSVQVLEGSSVFSARVPKCPLGVRVPQVTKCPSVLRVPHFSLSAFRVKKVWNITGSGLVNNFLEFLERILIHKLYYFLLP